MGRNKLSVVHTTVFGSSSPGGNPCPIVTGASDLTDKQMQAISAYFKVETGFILSPTNPSANVRLKFFVPHYEMEMCVHATIGAITVLLEQKKIKSSPITVETALGNIQVHHIANGAQVKVLVEQFLPRFLEINPLQQEVCQALRLSEVDLNIRVGPIQSVSTSRAKLIIPVKNYRILDSLQPNFKLLWTICEKYQTTGFYPFTIHPRSSNMDVETRHFPNNVGYNEDPATGVAAGALGAYLMKYQGLPHQPNGIYSYQIGQGYAMGKPSIIQSEIHMKSNKIIQIRVGGLADIISKETISIKGINISKTRH